MEDSISSERSGGVYLPMPNRPMLMGPSLMPWPMSLIIKACSSRMSDGCRSNVRALSKAPALMSMRPSWIRTGRIVLAIDFSDFPSSKLGRFLRFCFLRVERREEGAELEERRSGADEERSVSRDSSITSSTAISGSTSGVFSRAITTTGAALISSSSCGNITSSSKISDIWGGCLPPLRERLVLVEVSHCSTLGEVLSSAGTDSHICSSFTAGFVSAFGLSDFGLICSTWVAGSSTFCSCRSCAERCCFSEFCWPLRLPRFRRGFATEGFAVPVDSGSSWASTDSAASSSTGVDTTTSGMTCCSGCCSISGMSSGSCSGTVCSSTTEATSISGSGTDSMIGSWISTTGATSSSCSTSGSCSGSCSGCCSGSTWTARQISSSEDEVVFARTVDWSDLIDRDRESLDSWKRKKCVLFSGKLQNTYCTCLVSIWWRENWQ